MAWAAAQQLDEWKRELNESADPRIGSGRDNSTGGTISHLSSSGSSDSASLSSLGGTFVPVLVYSAVCLLVFLTLRSRLPRVYAPRTLPGVRPVPADALTPSLPSGWFNWLRPFFKTPDTFVLNSCSVDGFFFLRYLKVLSIICFAGCCLSWPVLLPLHGTGGNKLAQLDLLTIGNVANSYRFYAHVLVAWCFFGFILFMVSRECIFYINLRQAYLLAPQNAHRLSSRTVLFTCVPRRFLDAARIRKLFGDTVKNVWIPTNTKALQKLVETREKTAVRLEKAEIELIKAANIARNKQLRSQSSSAGVAAGARTIEAAGLDVEKADGFARQEESKGKFREELQDQSEPQVDSVPSTSSSGAQAEPEEASDLEYTHPYGLDPSLPDLRGSVAAQWIPAEARPSYRPIANLGRRVDTIRYTRDRLKTLNAQIARTRRRLRSGNGTPLNAAFVEFDSQASAQAAYQILAHHQPLHMSPRFIGIRPEDVVWRSLRMRWWERIMRRFLMLGLIAAGVIFWSIPSVLVGTISNIQFLSSKVPFLAWIALLPGPITGVIQGLLPATALSLLMAVVPFMLRACAMAAGVPSYPMVELFVQHAYFVFQLVQVFLVTTLTSAASAAFSKILADPLSTKDLLSENLPKASNFYLSYILVQCLAGGSWTMLHPLDLFRHQLLTKTIQHPRRLYRTWCRLRPIRWGSVFPVYTNMAVIAISYTCIAPLILLFAGLGMCFTYLVYKYNLMYSWDSDLDTKGLLYPRALMHLMVGLYLAQICLIGLFSLQSAFGPVFLMLVFLIFSILVHISLNDAVSPLLYNLPRTLALEDKDLAGEDDNDQPEQEGPGAEVAGQGAAAEYYNMEDEVHSEDEGGEDAAAGAETTASRGDKGMGGIISTVGSWVKPLARSGSESSGLSDFLGQVKRWTTPSKDAKPNFVIRWLHPEIYEDFRFLRQMLPADHPAPDYPEDYARRAYWPPEMWTLAPKLWIPRDEARVSRQEVAHTRPILQTFDTGARLDEKVRVVVDLNASPLREPKIVY